MKTRFLIRSALAAALSVVISSSAQADPTVFVADTGRNTPDCSRANRPCRTLDHAIAQVDPGGEVVIIESGSYAGATIAKSLTIEAAPGTAAVVNGAINVTAGLGAVVVLRGLTVKDPTPTTKGPGITAPAGASLTLENCVVDGWGGAPTGLAAIQVSGGMLHVVGTTVRNYGSGGILINNGSTAEALVTIDGSRFHGSGGSSALVCGVMVLDGGKATIRDSVVTHSSTGVCVDIENGGAAEMTVDHSLLTHNFRGIGVYNGAIVRVSNSVITNSTLGGLNEGGGQAYSLGNNLMEGNTTDWFGPLTVISPK